MSAEPTPRGWESLSQAERDLIVRVLGRLLASVAIERADVHPNDDTERPSTAIRSAVDGR